MGVRAGVIVCACSFLLGCFATHWVADSVTLWQSTLTDAHLHTAAAYYSILSSMPQWQESVIFFVCAFCTAALLLSVYDGRAGNIMFDSASLFLCAYVLFQWLTSVLPNLELLSPRIPTSPDEPFPSDLKDVTLEIASRNLLCSVALTGVLALQAGRQWAEAKDQDPSPAPLASSEKESSTAVEDVELDLGLGVAARGRRRSHHDHLEDDEVLVVEDLTSLRSPSRKRDSSYRKRKGGSLRR